jgi:uncharacterized membrane protein
VLVHLHGLQPHLLVALAGGSFVHAHAGLGRVVRQTDPSLASAFCRWRLDPKG